MNAKLCASTEELSACCSALFESCGYTQYKMSKFEEYDLYMRNKDFLISDSVITFTDTNGKLMALKPDVTLSIIKNSGDTPALTQKVYYRENVYRISKGTHTFKEIMQTGLECMGKIDNYSVFEVISLACRSLRLIDPHAVLDISHLGVVSSVLAQADLPAPLHAQIVECLSQKNSHEIVRICNAHDIDEAYTSQICTLSQLYGAPLDVLEKLKALPLSAQGKAAVRQMETVLAAFEATELYDMLRLDFSVVSDMNYYNGFVFKGFVPDVPVSVLSGGQYDRLMQRMHRDSGAIGFALYPDQLERLWRRDSGFDVDAVVLYDETASLPALSAALETLRKDGKRVCALREMPEKLRAAAVLKFENEEVIPLA